jgi:hypothetical protein
MPIGDKNFEEVAFSDACGRGFKESQKWCHG